MLFAKIQHLFAFVCLFSVSVVSAQKPATEVSGTSVPKADTALRQVEGAGIVKEKPSEGRFVDLGDGRFMVPYTAKIPGTDIEYSMEPIPGGTYTMGTEDGEDDTQPAFRVKVKPFWMSKFEMTWAEYWRYMQMDKALRALQEKGARVVTDENRIDAVTAPSALYDPSFTYEGGQEPEQCAATITQYAAKQYTKWLSLSTGEFFRLPYESEWEYACRAGTDTRFYFGDDESELEEHAWFESNAGEERHTVGELKPNPWGLHDMYGNASEWTLDQYSEEGYVQAKDMGDDDVLNPEKAYNKPVKLTSRVIRGGCFLNDAEACNSFARIASQSKEWRDSDPNRPRSPWWFTDEPATGVGFRLIRPLEIPSREAREEFWKADLRSIDRDARNRIHENGRGTYGIIDEQLDEDLAAEDIDMSLDDE